MAQQMNPNQVRGTAVVQNPSGSQTITSPSGSSININTSGGGTANYNGSPILTNAAGPVVQSPSGTQTITQPSGTNLSVNTLCDGTGPYNARACSGAQSISVNQVSVCNMTSGSHSITCTGITFTSDIIGQEAYVAGAGGSATTTLHTTVASVTSGSTITLTSAATSTATGTTLIVAADATAALQNAYDTAVSQGRALYIPSGTYMHHGLNFTDGDITIYGDGYQQSQLLAMAVTNPTQVHSAQTTGVDISGSQRNRVDNLVFYGGELAPVDNMADMAPQVNVLLARVTSGFAIVHSFNNDYFFQFGGLVNVFVFGYEQTSFVNCYYENDSSAASGNIVLSSINSSGFQSPYQTFVGTPNSTTKIDFSGAATVFAGAGSMVVIDQGSSEAVYTLGFHDTYTNMSGAGSAFLFIEGTGPVRGVEMNSVYGEICDACRFIVDSSPAWFWNITTSQWYTLSGGPLTTSALNFSAGILGSNVQVDVEGATAGNVNLNATSCLGSVLQLGQENATASCTDYAYIGSISGGTFNSVTATPYKANGVSGVTKTCTVFPTVVNGIITGC